MAEVPASKTSGHASAPTIVYIAGSGRSGTTLLERIIGGIPGCANVGELIDLPRRIVPRDELCGCGRSFSTCPYWSAVGERLPDGWSAGSMQRLHALQAQVARQRHIPMLMTVPRRGRFGEQVAQYARAYGEICRAVAQESDAEYVVDASKWPSLALALDRGGLDVRVIHLVRDVRGVAHSLGHKDIARPQAAADDSGTMFTQAPASAAARWLATQTEVDLLVSLGLPVARMRYGDLVNNPSEAVARSLEELAVSVPSRGLGHINGQSVTLTPSHGLSGNPSRFRHGEIQLKADARWKHEMARRNQILVQAIGLPQVVRFNQGHDALQAPQGIHMPHVDTDPLAGTVTARVDDYPLVSVVLPTRGRPDLVRAAIASVTAQSYAGTIEIIVIHDQEESDPRLADFSRPRRNVKVISNTHSPGLAGARNSGLEVAAGAFIATLDDDDSWHPTKVEKQLHRFASDPDVLALGTGIRLILSEGRSATWSGRRDLVPYRSLLRNRIKELHSSTLMMRRDAFAKAGRYDEGLPNGYAEDYDFVLRMARVGNVGIVREPLADIRKDGHSYYRGRAANTAQALEHFLRKHPDISADRRGHARILGQMAFARSSMGDRRKALGLAAQSVSRWPLSPHAYVALGHIVTGADPVRFAKLARRFGRGMA